MDFQADSALSENRRASAEPTAQERVEKALRHAQMLIAYKGEYVGIREAQAHGMVYEGVARCSGAARQAELCGDHGGDGSITK